ncbi:hypothetical protein GEMRC1_009915 [Eukaryota sp. GEM-RC1]
MSSIGTGYDLSPTTYSPDGRVFQVEYASKAVANSGTVVGLRVSDGVVFAVEKEVPSTLLVMSSQKRIYTSDERIGIAMAGLTADARTLASEARDQAKEWRTNFGTSISPSQLAKRLALHMHLYTMRSPVRPYGVSALIGGLEDGEPVLFNIDPSGSCLGYFATALGGRSHQAKAELEKLALATMTTEEAVKEAARILHIVREREQASSRQYTLEMTWVRSDGSHGAVPELMVQEADEYGRKCAEDLDFV